MIRKFSKCSDFSTGIVTRAVYVAVVYVLMVGKNGVVLLPAIRKEFPQRRLATDALVHLVHGRIAGVVTFVLPAHEVRQLRQAVGHVIYGLDHLTGLVDGCLEPHDGMVHEDLVADVGVVGRISIRDVAVDPEAVVAQVKLAVLVLVLEEDDLRLQRRHGSAAHSVLICVEGNGVPPAGEHLVCLREQRVVAVHKRAELVRTPDSAAPFLRRLPARGSGLHVEDREAADSRCRRP